MNKLYYFEIVHADDPEIAKACGCKVGQVVGRVYERIGGPPQEKVGTLNEVQAFIKETTKE